MLLTSVVGEVVLAATGRSDQSFDDLPLTYVALLQVPQWAATLGITWWAVQRKGNGLVHDLGLRVVRRDVPVGLAIGAATQVLLVPLLYLPILRLLDRTTDDVAEEARQLTDRATGLGVLLLILVVVLAAPVVEEIFYRGLLLRSLERRFGDGWALLISSVVFGAAHLQALQLPALVLFGLVAASMAQRSGRLGPSIFAHIAFNAVTVALLL
ncbi:MAG: lysostaphin resistance A-like protein [Actinomycetota bacterium]